MEEGAGELEHVQSNVTDLLSFAWMSFAAIEPLQIQNM